MEEYSQGKVSPIWQDMLGVNIWALWGYGHLHKKHAWGYTQIYGHRRYIALRMFMIYGDAVYC